MKKVILPFLLAASAACAGVVAITGDDGTTRLVDVPVQGTNWCGIVGVTPDRTIVTNMEAWARRKEARVNAGTILWADGTHSHFRLPKEGKTVAVSHEIKVLGKGNKRTRLVEVLWIDHEGKTVSNAIGRAAHILPYRPAIVERRQEQEDKAFAAAKRRPEPDADGRTYISTRDRLMRHKRKGGKPAKAPRPEKPAADKREKAPDDEAEKVLDEYRAKAEVSPSHVEKRSGK